MSNPSTLLAFIRASDEVMTFDASFRLLKEESHTVFRLEARLCELKRIWETVISTYNECICFFEADGKSTQADFEGPRAKFISSQNVYMECLAIMNERLHDLRSIDKQGPSTSGAAIVPPADNSMHNLCLPPCDTDIFRGDYLSWPAFRDLFTAIYIRNSRLSDIERLCHLIRKTEADARDIVSKFPLVNGSFELAWAALKHSYDNPRILVNSQLRALFNLSVLEKETSAGLKALQRGINSCLSAMSIYEVSTENWDPIIVFMCTQRLPRYTITLWEQSVKDKSSLSLWKDLDQFISERIQTLDCLRDLNDGDTAKKSTEKRVKSHATSAATSGTSSSSKGTFCVLCPKQGHLLRTCPRFRKMSVMERFDTVKKHHCCVNCLSVHHDFKNCTSQHNCATCDKRHHTLLHRDTAISGNSVVASAPSTSVANSVTVNRPDHSPQLDSTLPSTSHGSSYAPPNRQVFHLSQDHTVLLGTALVNIVHQGIAYPARALVDPASEGSFISDRLRRQLKIPVHSTNATISGVSHSATVTSTKRCALKIGTPLDGTIILETLALVLPSISGNLPSFSVPSDISLNIPGLRLADSKFFISRPVDLLLGADIYNELLAEGTHRNLLGSLVAQNTIFGWIITGSLPSTTLRTFATTVNVAEVEKIDETLRRFWELEEIPKRKFLSSSEQYCEENYKRTTRRNHDGRYIVSLPLRAELGPSVGLGSSRSNVLAQYIRGEKSLLRKPNVKTIYDQVIGEYLELGHMRPASGASECPYSCYLPHHPVINPDKVTTKLRVVFNASNKTSSGLSLNDVLHVGPALQLDLGHLIMRWRLFRFVFNCDITQMYRQILVDPSHTSLQKILHRSSPDQPIQDYELLTVTFGVNCAPYLAIRTLLQLADDVEAQFPLAARVIRRSMYVDDVLAGAHDIEEALASRDQLISALATAKFELRKWTANDRALLDRFGAEHLIDAQVLDFVESSCSKPLGIRWNAHTDAFYFRVDPLSTKTAYRKSEVLSIIAKLFDPPGWVGPVIIVAKIIMQKVWRDKIDWEDFLISPTADEWMRFIETYPDINNIEIPRWVRYTPDCVAELHVFSDASEKAYAGVIYLRVESPTGAITCDLLSCKTRVAPVKSVSLPRLELCGAVLASELLKSTLQEIDIPLQQIYCWSDSTVVLSWLKKSPCTWTTFVANRVCRIQENARNSEWRHVRSEDNPADLGSRGVTPSELAVSRLWWHGPLWLSGEKRLWTMDDLGPLETDVEIRPIKSHFSFFSAYEDVLERFSSLGRAMRVVAYIFRFFHGAHPSHRAKRNCNSLTLSSEEINFVKLRLAVLAQKAHFAEEYKLLLDKRPLGHSSALLSLNPILDDKGIMRLNGRLVRSPTLSYSERMPIILPYACRFSRLLVEFFHTITVHGGNQLMLRVVRIEYWIPRVKNLIRTVLRNCKICILDRKRSGEQIMAALPPERTANVRPFTNTGLDFAGPLDIKTISGRSCKMTKGYVCVFVCFSTKAVHLEAVTDLSTDSFLASFHRFISRRGCPHTIFSDNGTNFVGAFRELAKDFRIVLNECRAGLETAMGYQEVSWKFIPAGAPHMGGLWEAAVKSFKMHFRKQTQSAKYTFEELATLLARIEACLNSRPLCPLSEDPSDIVALTPGHFLIGAPLLAPPETTMDCHPSDLVNRYRRMKALSRQICIRWKDEYLRTLHERYRWKFPQRNISEDDLVVIKQEQTPPTAWRLGRVVKLHPGSDGFVRVADVRTEQGVVRRPITKLVVLSN